MKTKLIEFGKLVIAAAIATGIMIACVHAAAPESAVLPAGTLAEDLAECRIAALGTARDAGADAGIVEYGECARIARLAAEEYAARLRDGGAR